MRIHESTLTQKKKKLTLSINTHTHTHIPITDIEGMMKSENHHLMTIVITTTADSDKNY